MNIEEHNLDSLIGPTHFFGGLALGNVASTEHAGNRSNPKAAALQGLDKMKLLHDLGMGQLVMPPHPRPAIHALKAQGYIGSVSEMISDCITHTPQLLPIIYSSSAMWAANAATISASADSNDHHIHFTPANLISNAHRCIEPVFTSLLLKRIFTGDQFTHHSPLPDQSNMADEGAANHMRIAPKGSNKAVNIFIYGAGGAQGEPKQYPARQHLDASRQIAAQHGLDASHTLFLQQHPDVIDAGVFHNDVIATSNDHIILYHQQAFVDEAPLLEMAERIGGIHLYRVETSELSVKEAVSTYLFNSQIVTKPDGTMIIIAPRQCEHSPAVQAIITSWLKDDDCPINEAIYVDIDESMANGGGPACLRLRVWMTEQEAKQTHPGTVFSNALYEQLGNIIDDYYPDSLTSDDLTNPEFPTRIMPIYPHIARILDMPDLYDEYI